MSQTHHKLYYVPNGSGWQLEVKQCHPPKRLNKKRRPIVIIPGYGMNSFIFGYHPSGLSMESYFIRRGFEVWSVNLRGQGGSIWDGGDHRYGLWELAIEDLQTVIKFIMARSRSETRKLDLIGCSLGGTLAFIYAALVRRNHAGAIVGMGAPLRWEKVHPILRLVFSSPRILGKIPIRGSREIIKRMFPQLIKSPLVKLYLHPDIVDLNEPEKLIATVEDPSRFINQQIAEWVKAKDLELDGKNLTEEFRKVKNPLLCVLANSDGIVPPLTALSALEVSGSKIKETLVVGTDKFHFAHADLFISKHSHDMVFKPIADWLLTQYRK